MEDIVPKLILVILLIGLNAFFAASEYAIVAVRKTRIDELVKKGDFVARLIQKALLERENFISAVQLGMTIVNLILGWLGEPVIAKMLTSLLFFLPHASSYVIVQTLAVILSLLLLTFVSIVLGELIPKTIALYNAEVVAFIVIAPITVFARIFAPIIRILNAVNGKILTVFGLKFASSNTAPYSQEEIKIVLDEIQQGYGKSEDFGMLENVFSLPDKPIKDIMTPRTEIIAIEVNTTVSSLRTALDDSHSRFPVYKKTLDDVVGFVHVKDVYKLLLTVGGGKKLGETNLIRKVISVPESKKANDVLLDMRKKHVHLAVVYDEFGVMVGIVTLEDIIESLVGDIQDEFDKPLKGIKRNSDGSFLVDGTITVEKMQRRFRLPLKGQAYNTIGGVVFGLLGREPHIGDEVQIGHLYFEVISISGKRVSQILMKRQSKKQEPAP